MTGTNFLMMDGFFFMFLCNIHFVELYNYVAYYEICKEVRNIFDCAANACISFSKQISVSVHKFFK